MMTTLPDYLLNSPHLPIKEGMLLNDVVGLVAIVYGYDLDKTNYFESQAYKGDDGYVYFDLQDLNRNVLTSFKNRASLAVTVTDSPALQTLTLKELTWLAKQVTLPDEVLLNPFAVLSNGFVYDAMTSLGDWAYTLATLLNDYTLTGSWKMSSYADYSTSEFTLVYQGLTDNAPAELRLGKTGVRCLVVDIQAGKNQGLICFLVMQ